jgi:hypothetical protein
MATELFLSLNDVRAWNAFRHTDAVEEQSAWHGIDEDDDVWRLTMIRTDDIAYWAEEIGPPEDDSVAKVDSMVGAYLGGVWLPPTIVIELLEPDDDGRRLRPLDGSHRLRAAIRAGLAAVPCWLAREQ